MFKYCPACASEKIIFEDGKKFHCPDCGFVYYHNTAAATGCIITVAEEQPAAGKNLGEGDHLLFLVRGREPAKGMLDLPGGFVDPGEGALEGLYRELKEEIGWTPAIPSGTPLSAAFTLFASFPNIYPYKNINYNTCDLFFTVRAQGLREQDLVLDTDEIAAVKFIKPAEINFNDIAFDSARRAVQAWLTEYYH